MNMAVYGATRLVHSIACAKARAMVAHVWEHVAIDPNAVAGADVTFGQDPSADALVLRMVLSMRKKPGRRSAICLEFSTSLFCRRTWSIRKPN